MKIYSRKVLPDSSGDEHVGFFRRIDRLQYCVQKIRGPRPTIWKLLWQLGQQRITCRPIYFLGRILSLREVDMFIGISFHGRTGRISVLERGYYCNGYLT